VNSEIRAVLITGGDALMLSDNRLNWLLSEIRSIKHVEIIRIGTRIPVTMPQYIVNGSKGLGKTPILPQYLISNDDERL
jgi:L-lysine 2,3-aminomutase